MSKNFYLFDIGFIVIFVCFSLLFRDLIYGKLQVPYFIFNAWIAIKLVSKSKSNPGKHFYQALVIWSKKESDFFWEDINYSKEQLRRRMKYALKESKQ